MLRIRLLVVETAVAEAEAGC